MFSEKRFLVAVALSFLAVMTASTEVARGQAAGAAIEVASLEAVEQSVSDVAIEVTGGREIGALDVTLGYDPEVIELDSAQAGDIADNALFEYNEVSPGVVRAGVVASAGLSGDGSVLTLKFNVVGSVGDASTISIDNAEAWHYDQLIDLPVATSDGELTVVSGSGGRGMLTALVLFVVAAIVLLGLAAIRRSRRGEPAT